MDGEQPSPRVLTPQSRRERDREEMRAAILDAAQSLMREEGVAALNLHEVARRVGLRTQSLYYYFPSKVAIYDALFRLGTRKFVQDRDRALRGATTVWERLRAGIQAYMTFAQENPELWYLVFERPVPGFVPSEESMAESRKMLGTVADFTEEAIEAGEIAPGLTVAQTTDFVNAVMHGLTAAHLANEPHLPAGSGRFGGLIPAAVRFFEAAWGPERSQPETDTTPPGNRTAHGE